MVKFVVANGLCCQRTPFDVSVLPVQVRQLHAPTSASTASVPTGHQPPTATNREWTDADELNWRNFVNGSACAGIYSISTLSK